MAKQRTANWGRRAALLGAVALGASAAAEAGEMAVAEIEARPESRDACMARARDAAGRFRDAYGAGGLSEDSWTVYIWNGELALYDAVIMCPELDDGARAFVVVHGPRNGDALAVLQRLADLW